MLEVLGSICAGGKEFGVRNSGVLHTLFIVSPILWLIGINRQDFAITYSAKEHFNVVFCSGGILFLLFLGVHCTVLSYVYEPHREKTGFLPRRKQRRRPASQ